MEKAKRVWTEEELARARELSRKYKLGTLIGYSTMTYARLKEIGKSPHALKAFRDAKPKVSQLGRIVGVAGQRGSFSPGRTAIDDVRDAMVAGDVELFFTIISLYRFDALLDCLHDPTISGIIRGWEKDTDSGNQAARALLLRIGTAWARATYRRPPLSATEQPLSTRDAVAVSNAVSLRLRRYIDFRNTRRLPAEARALIEDELEKTRRIVPERKPSILSSFRRQARKWEETRSGHQA